MLLPSLDTIGQLATLVDKVLEDHGSEQELAEWFRLRLVEHTRIEHPVQTFTSLLICRYVFADSQLMFEGQHSGFLIKLYQFISSTGPYG